MADLARAFVSVDEMANPALLVQEMDETSKWGATRSLREVAKTRLQIMAGYRILDVGCGPGDAAIALARGVSPGGRVVALDISRTMAGEAALRAAAGAPVDCVIGDALHLAFPDSSFDACRSERTLQWLEDPARGLREMVRVTRPGGSVVVIDTDWGGFVLQHPNVDLTERLHQLWLDTGPGTRIGRQLRGLFVQEGLNDVVVTSQCHLFADWNPRKRSLPPGFPPFPQLLHHLVLRGELAESDASKWLRQLAVTASDGSFCAAHTLFLVAGRKL